MKNFILHMASDGVYPKSDMYIVLDQDYELPPGKYTLASTAINGVELNGKFQFAETQHIKPVGKKAHVIVHRCLQPRQKPPKAEPLDDLRADDKLARYEKMYRLMEKLYNGKQDKELDAAKDQNIDQVFDGEISEDDKWYLDEFGIEVDEETGEILPKETQPEPEPEPIEEEVPQEEITDEK